MSATKNSFDFNSLIENVDRKCRENVGNYLKTVDTSLDEKAETIKAISWLDWVKPLNYIKVVHTDIPDFILPKNCSGELIDVKVFSKSGPDDKIYDTYKLVRDRVARGNCFLRITRGPHAGTRCILHALKKFTGGLGDDDDRDRGDNLTWKKYFVKSIDDAKKVIATRKANGEAAHLSCIQIDGQILLCAGSKNVHMLIRNRGDIALYRGDRYRIASEVSHAILDALDSMEPSRKEMLLQFLIATRFTAVFEILSPDHQHVENLSHLTKPVVQFITWTSTELEPMPDQMLCTVPPHIGIELARALGLTTIDYEVIDITEVFDRMRKIRQGYQYEGEVLYFLAEDGSVIGLLKKKTVWYILCRAIREKTRFSCAALLKSKSSFSKQKSISQVEKRLDEIQKWLLLSDQTIQKWKDLGTGFLVYCIQQIDSGNCQMEDIADRFPVVWKSYLEVHNYTDEITVQCDVDVIDGEASS
ncbi:actin-binding protein ipp [Biomphalaria glabrata]|uniref:Uncharacterized protein LOC106061232 n=2 Tax=Biomphalaria glabrata TaxID=6526 RepID=A0A9W3ATL7_BIOGL|nr:uncharacterized protein LOC106061232 [Biomphalaria glabrata]KAI8762586.1 CAunnamed protein product [Biomphalaria glabrata]